VHPAPPLVRPVTENLVLWRNYLGFI